MIILETLIIYLFVSWLVWRARLCRYRRFEKELWGVPAGDLEYYEFLEPDWWKPAEFFFPLCLWFEKEYRRRNADG